MKLSIRFRIYSLSCLCLLLRLVHAAEVSPALDPTVWQYAVETKPKPLERAFLWIPPGCTYVRGVVLAQQVILEHLVMEDPYIRAAATREGLALVLLSPFNIGYTIDDPTQAKIDRALADLAAASGYPEIARAPLLTLGHSGGGIWTWNIAYRNPQRMFGVVTLKCAAIGPPTYAPKSSVEGIPILSVSGQYETWGVDPNPAEQKPADHHWRWLRGDLLALRGKQRLALNSELVEPGVTHFGWRPETARYVAMFIEKAAHRRIPANVPPQGEPVVLNQLTPESGWLADCQFMRPSLFPPAPFAEYTGDPCLAMWHLDGDLARANDTFDQRNRGKQLQMVTFLAKGQPLEPTWIQSLDFQPLSDGTSVKVAADFVPTTPPEMAFPAKRNLGHAPGPIQFRLIGGWTGGNAQTGPDTFRIKMDRLGYTRGFGTMMIMAYHPGDDRYAYCEQAVSLGFKDNKEGTPQTITFPPLKNQKPDAGPITLEATTDSKQPVYYFILAGPAVIQGSRLTITQIPAKASYPVRVTVVAYQWGRSIEPKFKTAKPVEQTFLIEK